MGSEADRLRLAIGVFYDVDRLVNALEDFFGLGLSADDLWLAGQRRLLETGSELRQAFMLGGGGLATLTNRIAAISELPGATPLWGTDGPLQQILMLTRSSKGGNWLEKLLIGDSGPMLLGHAESGAVIAAARAPTPAMQDQCVRVLLRHSLHTVHSQECRQDFGP